MHHPTVFLAVGPGIGPHHRATGSRDETQPQMREEGVSPVALRQLVQVDEDRARSELAVVVLVEVLPGRVAHDDQPLELLDRQAGQCRHPMLDPLHDAALRRPQHAGGRRARLRRLGVDAVHTRAPGRPRGVAAVGGVLGADEGAREVALGQLPQVLALHLGEEARHQQHLGIVSDDERSQRGWGSGLGIGLGRRLRALLHDLARVHCANAVARLQHLDLGHRRRLPRAHRRPTC
mmetsp:Transcript_27958/g.80089  ORF Transcript_27958/g.80089 Transcript_27958/m.80089 type:complete len:235 (+) Transcript_27958:1241-1945(+)